MLAIASLAVASTGCAPDRRNPDISPSTNVPLVALDPPPEAVPSLTANDIEIEPTQYQWLSDDGWERLEVTDPDSVDIPLVPASDHLTIRVDTAARPQIATLYEYAELDASGRPTGDPAVAHDCLEGAGCIRAHDNGATTFVVEDAPRGSVFTLVLVYARTVERGEHRVEMMSASWVFRQG